MKTIAEIAAASAKKIAETKTDTISFKTPSLEPPVVNALLALTYSQREELLQRMYIKAKNNIMEEIITSGNKDATQEEINAKIRKEMDRLVELYKETH